MFKILSRKKSNIHSLTTSTNAAKNELTLQEISDVSVDGLEKAIYFCKSRMNSSKEIEVGNKPENVISFILKEAFLSQLYGLYESYWNAILWTDFELVEVDEKEKIYRVQPPESEMQTGASASHLRKSKLGAQSIPIAAHPSFQQYYENDKYLLQERKGRKKSLSCLTIKNAPDEIRLINANWRSKTIMLTDQFDENLLESEESMGFSINDLLEVFRILIILSASTTRKYPNNDSVFNLKKMLEFCPTFDKVELFCSIKKLTGFNLEKTKNTLHFLEYKALPKQDLWCHPIISLTNKRYALSTASLTGPVMMRVVEHWMVSMGLPLHEKGLTFEKSVLETINKELEKNPIVSNFERAVSKRLKIEGAEEEVDLIVKIGNLVLIGEAKSIVTTDSPISNYRTVETLKHASSQAQRKERFVRDNLRSVFDKLGWRYDTETTYITERCILNSGRMYVGFDISGTPVCDEKILSKYFGGRKIPVASVFEKTSGNPRHLAWVNLYDDFDEMILNLGKYLRNPPQISANRNNFEHKDTRLPTINEKSYKIIFRRLVPKKLSSREQIEMDYAFPLEKAEDYDEGLVSIDFTI